MLSLTRKADYALVALVYLGCRQRQAVGPASARLVAETFDLPLPVLMNTLKVLARCGLIRSHRGVAGGYELARDPATVSLLEVVRAVEQDAEGDAETAPNTAPEDTEDTEVLEDVEAAAAGPTGLGDDAVRRLQQKLDGFLERLTLADLLDEPGPAGGPRLGDAKAADHAGAFVPLRTEAPG